MNWAWRDFDKRLLQQERNDANDRTRHDEHIKYFSEWERNYHDSAGGRVQQRPSTTRRPLKTKQGSSSSASTLDCTDTTTKHSAKAVSGSGIKEEVGVVWPEWVFNPWAKKFKFRCSGPLTFVLI